MITIRLLRPFTPAQQKIALGVGAGRSYVEIAAEVGCKPRTVRAQVQMMAQLLDAEAFAALAPRQLVFMYVKQQEWEDRQRMRQRTA